MRQKAGGPVTEQDGFAFVWRIRGALTDAEFRLLMTLAWFPRGDKFACSLHEIADEGMDLRSAGHAADWLAAQRDFCVPGIDTQFFKTGPNDIEWRFC